MPTYGYVCTRCENKFDVFHSMKCTDTQHCPTCGGEGKKLLSGASIIFKGSGFYSTDYRDSGYIEAQKRESTPGSSSTSSSSGGTQAASAPATSTATGTSSSSGTSTAASTTTPAQPSSGSSSSGSGGTGSGSTGVVAKAA